MEDQRAEVGERRGKFRRSEVEPMWMGLEVVVRGSKLDLSTCIGFVKGRGAEQVVVSSCSVVAETSDAVLGHDAAVGGGGSDGKVMRSAANPGDGARVEVMVTTLLRWPGGRARRDTTLVVVRP